jgi:hypothetical protein
LDVGHFKDTKLVVEKGPIQKFMATLWGLNNRL